MRHLFYIVFLFCFYGTQAQLYVSPSSYIFNKGQVLYVAQDVNLQSNSVLYLRSEGQLLQGTSGSSSNKGSGKISVFQEGTSDNFDYNYWCSPVGNASAATGNENFSITMLNQPSGLTTSSPASMLGMSAFDGTASPLAIAPRWIYKYINSNGYSQWLQVGTSASLAAGEGFTMKGTQGTDAFVVEGKQNNPGSNQRYDFRGKPNDGNIAVTVGTNNQTLTGNPYPSALHVNAFLLDPSNTACDGIAYYWEQNKSVNSHLIQQYQGGYGTYSPVSLASSGIYVPATFNSYDGSGNTSTTGTSSGLVISRKYAPIGQGFMVMGVANGSVTLRNSHRAYYKESTSPTSFFERNATASAIPANEDFPLLRINTIMNNQFTRQLALAFVPGATDGVDRGIDAKSPSNDLPNDVFFRIADEPHVIQGTSFELSKRIPLMVISGENANFKFYIAEADGFDSSIPVYIYDAADGSYHDIRSGFYEVTLQAGSHNDRFEITFVDSALSTATFDNHPITIFQNNNTQELQIFNPDRMPIASCALYDISGKQVIKSGLIENRSEFRFSTAALSDGIYIVRLQLTDGQTMSKKVTVVNNQQ